MWQFGHMFVTPRFKRTYNTKKIVAPTAKQSHWNKKYLTYQCLKVLYDLFAKKYILSNSFDFINVIGNPLIAESGDSKSRNSFLRGFPLPFNVETLQAFGALFQI
jgi:hypothetical protein